MTDTTQNAQANDNGDIARGSVHGRVLLGSAIVLAVALVVGFQFYAQPLLKTTALQSSLPNAIMTAKVAFIGLAAFSTLTAIVWVVYALRILRYRQDPPPGAWLWRDTKIVHGKTAVRRAWLSIIAAVTLSLLCVGFTAYITIRLDQLAAMPNMPYHVEVLPSKIPQTAPGTAIRSPAASSSR